GNWSKGVPTPSDNVCIEEKGTYQVTLEPEGSATVNVNSLKLGGSSGTQTLRVVATSKTGGANLHASEELTIGGHGVVNLTSTGEYSSRLEVDSGHTLRNAGTINAEAGSGGPRSLGVNVNNLGAVAIANGVALDASGTFTNGKSGVVSGG